MPRATTAAVTKSAAPRTRRSKATIVAEPTVSPVGIHVIEELDAETMDAIKRAIFRAQLEPLHDYYHQVMMPASIIKLAQFVLEERKAERTACEQRLDAAIYAYEGLVANAEHHTLNRSSVDIIMERFDARIALEENYAGMKVERAEYYLANLLKRQKRSYMLSHFTLDEMRAFTHR